MSVGRLRDSNMARVGKDQLLDRLKQSKKNGIFICDLIKLLVDNPDDEYQRPRVWSITQQLAELQRQGFVVLTPAVNWNSGKVGLMASAI